LLRDLLGVLLSFGDLRFGLLNDPSKTVAFEYLGKPAAIFATILFCHPRT
jgi:hypothetical protein